MGQDPPKLSYATPRQLDPEIQDQPVRVGSLIVVILFVAGPVIFFLIALAFALLLLQG
jgi:hypothetical protein